HATHPLRAELDIVRNYLDLEGLRLRGRLSYRLVTEGANTDAPIPCLLLQTLVENCIKHGIAPVIEGGSIELTIASQERSLRITLTNTGKPLRAGYRPGTGLTNTVRRLDLFAPGRHGFTLASGDGGVTIASFALPEAP